MKSTLRSYIPIFLSLFLFVNSCSKDTIAPTEASTQYTLTVNATEGGFVTPEANGTYNAGAQLTLSAIPNNGYSFCRWLGTDNDNSVCRKSELQGARGKSRCIIKMNSNRDVQAFFERNLE